MKAEKRAYVMGALLVACVVVLGNGASVLWDDSYRTLRASVYDGDRKVGTSDVSAPAQWARLETYKVIHSIMDYQMRGATEAVRLEVPSENGYNCVWGIKKDNLAVVFWTWGDTIRTKEVSQQEWHDRLSQIVAIGPWGLPSLEYTEVFDARPYYVSLMASGKVTQFVVLGADRGESGTREYLVDDRGDRQMRVVRLIQGLMTKDADNTKSEGK